MFPAASLLSTLLLAFSVAASPVISRDSPISLPIARRINKTGGTINLVQHDQARAQALINRGKALASGTIDKRQSYSIDVINEATSYIAEVGVGDPATTYYLIVDTGSSNTWVGADTKYTATSTSEATGYDVEVTYGSGEFSGEEYLDTVTLSSSLVITQQSIGVATKSEGFDGVDGIIGIGPLDLTEGTLTNDEDATIPTVTGNLYSQGTIGTALVAVSFEPTTTEEVTNGELTFGGTDSSKYTGDITYVDLTTTEIASYYWGIDQSVTYGSTSILGSDTPGIVDTGTTLVLFSTSGYDAYKKATDSTLDDDTGLLRITTTQYDDLDDLNFVIGGTTFTLTANGQIWPRSLNTYIGGTTSYVYLVVNDLGSEEGMDFINGYTFLERFYTVFDTTNSRVGFATTSYTDATTN